MINRKSAATAAIQALPDKVFYKTGTQMPRYNGIFAAIVRTVYAGHLKSASDLIKAIGEGNQLNLSSFQRAVAIESARRKKKENK